MDKTLINRVAGLTLFFWIVKILSTTVGETAADFIAVDMNVGLMGTTLLMGAVTIGVVFWNFKMKKYFAPAYWFLIVMMSIEGTLITDILVDNFEISLITLDVIFTIMMITAFYLWYKEEGALSIHKITNNRREAFYWLIVLITFALGTGVGLFYTKILDGVTAFWIAFIVTRPIGASLGDLFIQSPQDGGMGIGAGTINITFFVVIIAIVSYLTISKTDVIEVKEI